MSEDKTSVATIALLIVLGLIGFISLFAIWPKYRKGEPV